MKHLKKLNTKQQHDSLKANHDIVASVGEDVYLDSCSHWVSKYQVTDISKPTTLIGDGFTALTNDNAYMQIDGVEQAQLVKEYHFDSVGQHEVSLDSIAVVEDTSHMYEGATELVSLDFSQANQANITASTDMFEDSVKTTVKENQVGVTSDKVFEAEEGEPTSKKRIMYHSVDENRVGNTISLAPFSSFIVNGEEQIQEISAEDFKAKTYQEQVFDVTTNDEGGILLDSFDESMYFTVGDGFNFEIIDDLSEDDFDYMAFVLKIEDGSEAASELGAIGNACITLTIDGYDDFLRQLTATYNVLGINKYTVFKCNTIDNDKHETIGVKMLNQTVKVTAKDSDFYVFQTEGDYEIEFKLKNETNWEIKDRMFDTYYNSSSLPMYEGSMCTLTGFNDYALEGCVSIGSSAFRDCGLLASIEMPSSVTSIGWCAFSYCDGLTNIEIPSSVTSIWGSAFDGCRGLTSVTFAEDSQLTSIGDAAFESCKKLSSIELPSSVTSIERNAFYRCDSLVSVTYNGITYTSKSALKTALIDNGVNLADEFNNTGLSA